MGFSGSVLVRFLSGGPFIATIPGSTHGISD
jgi:hypothetical protein